MTENIEGWFLSVFCIQPGKGAFLLIFLLQCTMTTWVHDFLCARSCTANIFMYTKVCALAKCNLFQRAIEKAFGVSSNIESVMLGFTVNLDEKQKKVGWPEKFTTQLVWVDHLHQKIRSFNDYGWDNMCKKSILMIGKNRRQLSTAVVRKLWNGQVLRASKICRNNCLQSTQLLGCKPRWIWSDITCEAGRWIQDHPLDYGNGQIKGSNN